MCSISSLAMTLRQIFRRWWSNSSLALLQSKILSGGMHRPNARFSAPLFKNWKPWVLLAQTRQVDGHLQLSLYPDLAQKYIVSRWTFGGQFHRQDLWQAVCRTWSPRPNSSRFLGLCEDLLMSRLLAIDLGSLLQARQCSHLIGQNFASLILTVAAAETSIGLAILGLLQNSKHNFC
jgi:hypothetical protein